MVKFKMYCPDCGAVIITASPQAVIWEVCPGCGTHFWDRYDALMAEVYAPEKNIMVECGRNA